MALAAPLSVTAAPSPSPEYVLRGHEAQINTVAFASAANLLFSGDADGYVAVWSLDTFRPLAFWKAHAGSVLTVASWADDARLLTHGRDNKIHAFDLSTISGPSASGQLPSVNHPAAVQPLLTVETNALGYCKCSLLSSDSTDEALVAVPSTLDDTLADIYHLPSGKRVHRSIGKGAFDSKTGTVMCLHLYKDNRNLSLIVAYEDGRICVFSRSSQSGQWSEAVMEENRGWSKVHEMRAHKEPIMGLCFDALHHCAWTVSADHLVTRYTFPPNSEAQMRAFKTAYPGRAAVTVRGDGRILAIAGWDGAVRVHSAVSFKPLAVLEYHRDSLYAVAFQDKEVVSKPKPAGSSELERHDSKHQGSYAPWLAAGGADQRISLWKIFPLQPA